MDFRYFYMVKIRFTMDFISNFRALLKIQNNFIYEKPTKNQKLDNLK